MCMPYVQVCYAAYASDTSSGSAVSPAVNIVNPGDLVTPAGRYSPLQEGWCSPAIPGLLLPRSYPTPWPTPLAYFPLTQVGVVWTQVQLKP
jgi:hypothetical protein